MSTTATRPDLARALSPADIVRLALAAGEDPDVLAMELRGEVWCERARREAEAAYADDES